MVLLILAGVTISQMTGSESAMEKATEAREKNDLANELEEIKLCVVNSISKGLTGLVTDDKLREELNGKVKNIVTNTDNTWTVEANSGIQYKINSGGMVTEVLKVTNIQAPSELIEVEQGSSVDLSTHITTTPSSNIENLKYTKIGNNEKVIVNGDTGVVSVASDTTVGEEIQIEIAGSLSTNIKATCTIKIIKKTNKYGNLVTYQSKYEKDNNITIGWRLFYRDKENTGYTYIIADKLSKEYEPMVDSNNTGLYIPYSDTTGNNGNYNTGETFDNDTNKGKFLNSLLLNEHPELFGPKNENTGIYGNLNINMKAVAWLCDTTKWNQFESDEIYGEWCVAGPSDELYVNSYNESAMEDNNTLFDYVKTR